MKRSERKLSGLVRYDLPVLPGAPARSARQAMSVRTGYKAYAPVMTSRAHSRRCPIHTLAAWKANVRLFRPKCRDVEASSLEEVVPAFRRSYL